MDELFEDIRQIEGRHRVSFRIAFRDKQTPSESKAFLSALEEAAKNAPEDRCDLVIEGIAAHMFPEAHAAGSGLSGPVVGGDLWPRMASLLTRKAGQALGSQDNCVPPRTKDPRACTPDGGRMITSNHVQALTSSWLEP